MSATSRPRRLAEVVAVGTAGSALMAWWAWRDAVPGHPEQIRGIHPGSWMLGLLGLVMLLAAWLRSAPLRRSRGLVAICWGLPMLVTRPMLSLDAWAYAAQGWLLAHGLNPYRVPQGQAGPMGAYVDGHWVSTTAVYPPGSLWIQAAMTTLAHGHPYWAAAAMRIPAVLGLVLIAVSVSRLSRMAGGDPDRALWLTVANPVVLLNFVGGAHNDALQLGLGLVALWAGWSLAARGRPWAGLVAGGVLVGLAGTVKQPGVLFGLGLVALVHRQAAVRSGRDTWGALIGRTLAGAVPAVAAFAGVSAIGGLGLGWLADTAGSPASVTSDSPIAMAVQIIGWTGVPVSSIVPVATAVSLGLTVVAIVACWAVWGPLPGRRTASASRPLALQAGAITAFAVCGAGLQPWYLVGALAVACLAPLGRRGAPGLVLCSLLGAGLCFLQWFSSPFLALPLMVLAGLAAWRIPASRSALDAVAAGSASSATG